MAASSSSRQALRSRPTEPEVAYRKPSAPFAVYTACESRRYWMRTLGCAVVMICSCSNRISTATRPAPQGKRGGRGAEKGSPKCWKFRRHPCSTASPRRRKPRTPFKGGGKPRSAKHPCGPQGWSRKRKGKACCAGSVKEGGEGAPPSSEMECSSAYNIFSKKRCPVWEITPPTFIVPVSAS